MNRGLYAAASAMLVQETNLDVITHNLANVDTPGYKRRVSANADFSAHLDRIEKVSEDSETKILTYPPFQMNWKGRQTIGTLALSSIFSEDVMDATPGVVKHTGNPLDIAIDGSGFFAVADSDGNTYYTREGNFMLSGTNNIVTPEGLLLQGTGGEITIAAGARSIEVTRTGQILVNGDVAGQVAVFNFDNPTYLRQLGGNLLSPTEQSGDAQAVNNVRVFSGSLEMSNVGVVEEMTRMIEAQRIYEGASKALTTHDEQTTKLITSYSRG